MCSEVKIDYEMQPMVAEKAKHIFFFMTLFDDLSPTRYIKKACSRKVLSPCPAFFLGLILPTNQCSRR